MRAIWLIARSVLIEAIRRREIYAIVAVSTVLIGAVMSIHFFEIAGLEKFYREVALKIMSVATALTVVVLAARQLPREFETRTIYPLLARPIGRATFLAGKLLGVLCAAAFCFGLFMAVYLVGTRYVGGEVPWGLFLQYVYLQMVMMLLLATLSFVLSMVLNFDAAVTIGTLLFGLGATFTTMTAYLEGYVSAAGRVVLMIATYAIPQLTLLDLSEKAVHAAVWEPLSLKTMAALTAYGAFYIAIYFAIAMLLFRRRAL